MEAARPPLPAHSSDGLPGFRGECKTDTGAESLQTRVLDRKRMAWVVASQTEDAAPDGEEPVNLDGAPGVARSLVLLSFD